MSRAMAAPGAGKCRETGRPEIISLIEQESAGGFIKKLQQPVDVHQRQIIDWQKISRAGRMSPNRRDRRSRNASISG